jgi:ribosomal protein L3 glutamine methyltransferase
MKLSELIRTQSTRLAEAGVSFGHGTTNALDEAAWLVLHAVHLPVDHDTGGDDVILTADQVSKVQALITERIATRKPAAYLTHQAWLQGVPFYVDERVIVPRSLIAEVLADGDIDTWLSERTTAVLDLCTGNGSLAVLAAMAWPDVQVTAADLSTDALQVARINIEKHHLQSRVRTVQSDLFTALQGEVFDLILCNPPYVNTQSMSALPPEYRAEPVLALAGGSDGMDLVRQIIAHSSAHMSRDAVLVLEIGNEFEHFQHAFSPLEAVWLGTSAGDDQVCLITRDALVAFAERHIRKP